MVVPSKQGIRSMDLENSKHFSFTSALFSNNNSLIIFSNNNSLIIASVSTARACKINVAESFFWYGFKNECIHLTELPF